MDTTLVILAAGLGSRFGGLKQMESVGPNGETIGDYSVYDAKRAGFNKVVFVITKEMEDAFYKQVVRHLEPHINCELAFQELEQIPNGFEINGREKPWGTGHALLSAKDKVNEPFMVINADDDYGVDAYKTTYDFLVKNQEDWLYSMVGFHLKNTASDQGTVNRGLCQVNGPGHLSDVKEARGIHSGTKFFYEEEGEKRILDPDQLVSMNCWGFQPSIFIALEEQFKEFLASKPEASKEFDLPAVVNQLIHTKKARVEVLSSTDTWYGFTYKEDKKQVVEALDTLIKEDVYPKALWNTSKVK